MGDAVDCFICDKHARGGDVPGGVIFSDAVVYAGHTHPMTSGDAALGYLMVEPRRHVPRLGDMTDEEASAIGVVVNRLSRTLRTTLGVEHVYSFVFGDRVPHLHVHLAPRYPDAPEEVFGLGAVGIQHSPIVPRGGVAEIQDVCDQLRAGLGGPGRKRWRQSRWLRSRSCDDMELVAHNPRELPDGLPIPEDDGAGAHLLGLRVPHIRLMATDGRQRDIADLSSGPVVIYVYPRTGVPGVEMPEGWDLIPGARGCTPQACAYRDDHAAFEAMGVGVLGLSTQDINAQREFAEREHIPFPLLSDPDIRVGRSLRLPTFQAGGDELYKRLTLVIGDGKVVYARYPVFPPDGDAAVTLAWLRSSRLR